MVQYTFKDIEVFLLDDDLFQWAKSGFADNGFDIESYKLQHPGCEERIELAIAVIRSIKLWKILSLLLKHIKCKVLIE